MPFIPAFTLTEADERRFRTNVALPDAQGCMLWTASLDKNGYGQFRLSPRTVKAHLVSVVIAGESFPPMLEPDHVCEVRSCTCVDHLEWVTHAENMRRSAARRTHCQAGLHLWIPANLRVLSSGYATCRICDNENKQRIRARRK
jgi:hypothetical protein